MGTERDEIRRRILDVVRTLGHGDAAVDDRTTFAELGIDSLDLVELALAIEERWAIDLRPDDYDRLRTVGDAVELVEIRACADHVDAL